MNEQYIKTIYTSDTIGKEKIVLELTTFDLEKFKENEKLEKIPTKRMAVVYSYNKSDLLNNPNMLQEQMEKRFLEMFENTYKKQLEDMKGYIEYLRKNGVPQAQWYSLGSYKECCKEKNRLETEKRKRKVSMFSRRKQNG